MKIQGVGPEPWSMAMAILRTSGLALHEKSTYYGVRQNKSETNPFKLHPPNQKRVNSTRQVYVAPA